MKLSMLLLLAFAMAEGCGGSGSGSTPSQIASPSNSAEPAASASPTASPLPSEGAYGVLITPSAAATYTISLVGFDGKVAASAHASSPAEVTCGGAEAAVLPPPVSTSNSRVYFMDAQGVVRFLTPKGDTGRATTVPIGSGRRSMFAVSPDDQRIAVVVSDFTSSGAATSLYVEDLSGGGHHKVIFTETGTSALWPIGWHGTSLVVAKVPPCTQGGGPFCCGPQELHVIDATTAVRSSTLGGPGCLIAGPPSASGAICESDAQANVLDWTGTSTRSFAIQGQTPAYLSPNGNQSALVSNSNTVVEGSHTTFTGLQACGWIDSARILGTDSQGQPGVGDWVTGIITPVAAQGTCGGRIPGGL